MDSLKFTYLKTVARGKHLTGRALHMNGRKSVEGLGWLAWSLLFTHPGSALGLTSPDDPSLMSARYSLGWVPSFLVPDVYLFALLCWY